jgi:hypothetical protein
MFFYNINYFPGAGLSNSNLPLSLSAQGGQQLYQGSELSPSFSPGTFAPGVVVIEDENDFAGLPGLTNPGPIVISAVPEPSSFAQAMTGCLGALMLRLRLQRAEKKTPRG